MELGCTRRGFGRDVQPAAPNRPRCWVLVGPMLGVRLFEAFRFCTAFLYGIGLGVAVSRWTVTVRVFAYRGNSIHLAEDTLFC